MKKITATLAATLLFGLAGNALAAYTTEGTVSPANGIITVISPVDTLDSRGIVTVIEPVRNPGDGGIVTVIESGLNEGLVPVVEPMDFSFTQLAYSDGFFFDTADTFGSGNSRMSTISSGNIRSMGAFFPRRQFSPIITEIVPNSPGIVTVIEPANATTVPVPPALFLMGSGLAGLAGFRLKRKP
ncbi:MAG: PEP-CTERM sorting domain-containing protein [Desulfuromonadales bacterium]|nr:MAG: PEP-CTERM sorting domain-containing protein [Desulfuromonadales bacterium]